MHPRQSIRLACISSRRMERRFYGDDELYATREGANHKSAGMASRFCDKL